jgi:hypothetical protein
MNLRNRASRGIQEVCESVEIAVGGADREERAGGNQSISVTLFTMLVG